jgi:Tfp pilus assembly protein PilF
MKPEVLRRAWLPALIVALASAAAFGQVWRGGHGRVEGSVKDPQGNPVVGATVSMRMQAGEAGGPDLKTDKKGRWAILGIVGGMWNVDISAPGFETRQISYNVKEFERNPNIDVVLAPAVKKEPAHEEITVAGKKISKETADALEKGNAAWDEALKAQEAHDACRTAPAPGADPAQCEKAADAQKKAKFAEATGFYEKALAELSDNTALLTKLQMAGYLTQGYDQAVKYAKMIVEKDPGNTTSWLMIAEIELTKGNLAEGKAALEKVPPESITDPTVYMNMGIICYNKNLPDQAEIYFTKAIEKKADLSEAYYYRGLARYQAAGAIKNKQQAAGKHAEAKSDFQKYMQIDPNGKDADTVKELLKTLK